MPFPQTLARVNRVFTNRLMLPLARLAPGFGVLQHRGRKSGVAYETPLNVFRDGDRLIVALTYGEDVDWLKNTRASPESTFIIGNQPVRVEPPVEISTEVGLAVMPAPVAAVLKMIDVTSFVAFSVLDQPE